MMTIDREASFACFIYPFQFDPDTFKQRSDILTEGAEPAMWTVSRHFTHHDLLPHVTRYLRAMCVLELSNTMLTSFDGLGGRGDWFLITPSKICPAIPFRLSRVELALFPVGIGFMLLSTEPQDDAYETWCDFLHYFRFAEGERDVRLQIQRRTGKDQWERYFPVLAGGLDGHSEDTRKVDKLLKALLRTGNLPGERQEWWRDCYIPGRLMPFTALYVDGLTDEDETAKAHVLYRLRNFFHATQFLHPTAQELRLHRNAALLPYVDNQWLVFSLEGGAFVAFNAPPRGNGSSSFFRETLPVHLQRHYFLLYLLSLHQRFALLRLSQMVSERWLPGDDKKRVDEVGHIYNAMLEFSARGYFSQVTQKENQHRYYQRCQQVLQIKPLYEELRRDLYEMHHYVLVRHESAQTERESRRERRARRLQKIGTLVTFPISCLMFLIALFSILGLWKNWKELKSAHEPTHVVDISRLSAVTLQQLETQESPDPVVNFLEPVIAGQFIEKATGSLDQVLVNPTLVVAVCITLLIVGGVIWWVRRRRWAG